VYNQWDVGGEAFVLEDRYTLVRTLGSGAYGTVCEAYDDRGKRNVAIKKCRDVFKGPATALRMLREVRLLRLLNHVRCT
jgi:serine/threonine protein kinase